MRISPDITVIPVSLTHASALATLVKENSSHLKVFLPKVAGLSTFEAARDHLSHVIEMRAAGQLYEWHIFNGNELCGAIRLNQVEPDNRKASIAYYLGATHQGAGLATMSVRAVIAYCFKRMDLNRIELRCASENMPSQRMAKRLGFTWEGMLRQAELLDGAFVDHFVYSLLRQEC